MKKIILALVGMALLLSACGAAPAKDNDGVSAQEPSVSEPVSGGEGAEQGDAAAPEILSPSAAPETRGTKPQGEDDASNEQPAEKPDTQTTKPAEKPDAQTSNPAPKTNTSTTKPTSKTDTPTTNPAPKTDTQTTKPTPETNNPPSQEQSDKPGGGEPQDAGTPSAQPEPAPQEPATPTANKDTALKYVGKSAASLRAAIGAPKSTSYASSCLGEGEDGEWIYEGFTVYTYRNGSTETVQDID